MNHYQRVCAGLFAKTGPYIGDISVISCIMFALAVMNAIYSFFHIIKTNRPTQTMRNLHSNYRKLT